MTFGDLEGHPIEPSARMRLAHNGARWTWRALADLGQDQPAGFLIVRLRPAVGRPEPVSVLVPAGRSIDRAAVRTLLASTVRFPRGGGTTVSPLTCRRLILDSELASRDTVLVPDRDGAVEMPTTELTDSYLFQTVVAAVALRPDAAK